MASRIRKPAGFKMLFGSRGNRGGGEINACPDRLVHSTTDWDILRPNVVSVWGFLEARACFRRALHAFRNGYFVFWHVFWTFCCGGGPPASPLPLAFCHRGPNGPRSGPKRSPDSSNHALHDRAQASVDPTQELWDFTKPCLGQTQACITKRSPAWTKCSPA